MLAKKAATRPAEISRGIINALFKVIKFIIIFTIIIPGAIYLIIRFLEIAFGFAWEQQLTFQLISYAYGICYVAYITYKASKHQLHTTVYYSIGWLLGLVLLHRVEILSLESLFMFSMIPIAFLIIKIISVILLKKPKSIYRKRKRLE